MKKVIYILTAALVALTACTKEIDWNDTSATDSPDAVYPEGASIDLVFGIPMPPLTKGAMDDDPIIDDDAANDLGMHVAVFDGSGALKQYELAEFDPVTENGSGGMKYFKVNLFLRSSEARLHFIANGPKTTEITSGMESALLQQWVTEYPNAAYWQRIVLPDGITAYSFSATKKAADGTQTPWVDGDYIYFYYYEHKEGEETVIDHINERTYNQHQGETGYDSKEYRIQFNNGRPYYVAGSQTINVGDYVNAKGEKITNGTGYFQSASITDAVASVPLVRNFARIKIKAGTGGNFTPKAYYLMNIPNKGTIAPYSSAIGGFAQQYSVSNYLNNNWVSGDPAIYTMTEGDTENHETLMTSLNGSLYPAAIPMSGELIHTPEEAKAEDFDIASWGDANGDAYSVGAATADVASTPSAFMFERGIPNKNEDPTYLLIGGTLQGFDDTRWFKVELTNASGQYVRIFRDVTYFLEIGNINGSDGYPSPEEAAVGNPVSDVSNSLETQDLNQISDGKGTSMWVEYIDYTGVQPAGEDGKGEQKSILYKVYDTSSGEALPATINGQSRYSLEFSGEAIESILSQNVAYSGVGPDGETDWMQAVVQLKGSTSSMQHGELRISGITKDGEELENGKALSRNVRYHVMGIQNLTLSATPLATEASKQETKLTITLPKLLGSSLFPLVLKIEAEKANLQPIAAKNMINGVKVDLPVDTGTSYFKDKNSFGYLFTINYSDYYDRSNTDNPYNNVFDLYFETTKDFTSGSTGTNETYISVTDVNDPHYFFYKPENEDGTIDEANLYNTTENKAVTLVSVTNGNQFFTITPTTQTVSAETETATFTIKTNGTQSWTVTGGTGVQVSPSSGTGNGVVTMKFTANTGNTRNFEATVKHTPSGGTEQSQTVTVTQKRIPRQVQRTININSGTISDTGTYNGSYSSSVSMAFTYPNNGLDRRDGHIRLTNRNGNSLSISADSITRIVINYVNGYVGNNTSSTPTGVTNSGTTTTWSGSSDTVTFSFARSDYGSYRISSINVTYLSDED